MPLVQVQCIGSAASLDLSVLAVSSDVRAAARTIFDDNTCVVWSAVRRYGNLLHPLHLEDCGLIPRTAGMRRWGGMQTTPAVTACAAGLTARLSLGAIPLREHRGDDDRLQENYP